MRKRYLILPIIMMLVPVPLTTQVAYSCVPIINSVVKDVEGLGKVNITLLPNITAEGNGTYRLTLKVIVRGPPVNASLTSQGPLTMQVLIFNGNGTILATALSKEATPQETLNLSHVTLTLSADTLPGVPYYANVTIPLNIKGKPVNLTAGSTLSIPVSTLLMDLSNAPEIEQCIPPGKTITYNVSNNSIITYRATTRVTVVEGVEYLIIDESPFPGCVPVPPEDLVTVLNKLVSDGYLTASNSTLRALINAYTKYVRAVSSMGTLGTVKRELRYVVNNNSSPAPQAGKVTYAYAPLITWHEGKPVTHAVLVNPPTLLPRILEELVGSRSQSPPTNSTMLMAMTFLLFLTAVTALLIRRRRY